MLAVERLDRIAEYLQQHAFLAVETGCQLLDASPATVRRDFIEIVAQGRAERHRGGVGKPQREALAMVPFTAREQLCAQEKSAIAQIAVSFLRSGDAVFVDGGTSTLHVASHLGSVPVRVITNSLRLASAIGITTYQHPIEVHLTGGYLVARGGLLIGPQARAGIAAYHTKWAFVSVGGIGSEGVYNTDELVQDVEREMIARADRVIVLADHTKLGVKSLCRVCDLQRIHVLVTDAAAPVAVLNAIRSAGVEVRVASPAPG